MANMTFAASVVAELFDRQFGQFLNMLNYGMEVLDLFERSKAQFNGASFEYPMTIARAGHGRYQGEGATQPTPSALEDQVVKFEVTEYIDKLGFTWRFLSQGESALLKSKIKRRIQRAFDENREFLDQVSIFGNATRGLVNSREVVTVAAANVPVGTLFRTTVRVFDYSGDHSKFATAALATPASWVPVTLRALDDYAPVAVGHGITVVAGADINNHLYVTGSDELAGTVNIICVSSLTTTVWGLDPTSTSVCANGFAFSLELDNTTTVTNAAGPPVAIITGLPQFGRIDPATGVAFVGDASWEMAGIFQNLFSGTWCNIDRTLVANAALRSNAFTMATGGAHNRAAFTAERVSFLIQSVKIAAGRAGKFTHMLCNLLVVTRLIAAVTTTLQYHVKGDAGTADLGPRSVTMLGFAPHECLNVPNGMIIGINKDCWQILTVGGKMVDIIKRGDASGVIGGPLFKSSDVTTSSDTVFYGIHQLVCDRPNANGCITGITLV